jgi:hypothetical protein
MSPHQLLWNPITGSDGCCARATSGHETAVPPRSVMNSRRFTAPTPNPRTRRSIAGQGRASQQKPPALVRLGVMGDGVLSGPRGALQATDIAAYALMSEKCHFQT